MKRFGIVIMLACLIVMLFSCSDSAIASSPFIPTEGLGITEFVDISTDNAVYIHRQELAHQMAECARALGYCEDNPVITIAKTEWYNCEEQIKENINLAFFWETKFEEYPYATYVWLYLTKGLGYNGHVAAGIIGNMMAEVGANTLDLQYWLYSYGGGFYFGLCQWGKTWFPEVRGMDLIGQCDYLAGNIEKQISEFGRAYSVSNAFEKFLQSESCRDAALMFAKWYEACDSGTYSVRQKNAEKAYEYFTMGLN